MPGVFSLDRIRATGTLFGDKPGLRAPRYRSTRPEMRRRCHNRCSSSCAGLCVQRTSEMPSAIPRKVFVHPSVRVSEHQSQHVQSFLPTIDALTYSPDLYSISVNARRGLRTIRRNYGQTHHQLCVVVRADIPVAVLGQPRRSPGRSAACRRVLQRGNYILSTRRRATVGRLVMWADGVRRRADPNACHQPASPARGTGSKP